MTKELKVSDWNDRGYRRFEIQDRALHKLADFMLQKLIQDKLGRKYYITVYCYDRTKYPDYFQNKVPEVGFMSSAHFSVSEDGPYFNVEMNGIKTIEDVEQYYEQFWVMLNKPYYEKNHD